MFLRISPLAHWLTSAPIFYRAAFAQSALKTASECEAEYTTNKAALKTGKETKRQFMASCRALPPVQPTPVGTNAAAPATPLAPAPQQKAAPASPAPTPTVAPAAPSGDKTYSHMPAAATSTEFPSEAAAKSRCPGATVVWVNTNSGVYHFAGTHNYGHTKEGAYMCETDATAAGGRASKTETHP
jgi:hypothetical protein